MLRRRSVVAIASAIALSAAVATSSVAIGGGSLPGPRASIADAGQQTRLQLESYCLTRKGGARECSFLIGARGPRVSIGRDSVESFRLDASADRVSGQIFKRRANGTQGIRDRSRGMLVPGSNGREWTLSFPDIGRRWERFRLRVFYRDRGAPQQRSRRIETADFVARRR